ncbi:hypothetical protein KPH14_010289 [Odynerus spinipes]|uniref:Uncharacterized protein n=1 Tax=Odynerus spinipes TaxID=1348599 RepID=A0AAD9RTR6_9HYME|nr:hypothetical protein KPH14_010289 [Odynerus spinipes]
MGLLILLLLCPTVFGQVLQKSKDPNDEPFLPIFPVYPYSPKLMKRGIDKETETRLTAELYAPKVDAKDSYTASYGSNYPRDPYYPNYDPYPKTVPSSSSSSSSSSYSPSYTPYYSTSPHTMSNSYSTLSPYNVYDTYANPYTASATRSSISSSTYTAPSYPTSSYSTLYPPNPYSSPSYSTPPYVPVSNYYYQHPYYYPAYYAPPLFQPPPPPQQQSDYNKDLDSDGKETDEKDSGRSQKSKDEDKSSEVVNDGQYVDGGNYISSNSRDLESQSSSYKVANPYNQLEQASDFRQPPLPSSGTYKIINVGAQPSDAEYSIAATYAKTQQLEQLMRQTLAKLLAQNAARQIVRYPTYDNKQNSLIKANEVFYGNQNSYDNKNAQAFIAAPNTIAKTGLSYIINPQGLGNVNSGSLLPRQVLQGSTTLSRSNKYSDDQYLRKPVTRVSLQQSQGLYIPPNNIVKSPATSQSTSSYETYEDDESSRTNQNYGDSLENTEGKQEQSYENDQSPTGSPYKNQNFVTVQTPQVYTYRYTSIHPQPTANQQDSQEYDDNASTAEFGSKQNNKP